MRTHGRLAAGAPAGGGGDGRRGGGAGGGAQGDDAEVAALVGDVNAGAVAGAGVGDVAVAVA